MFINIISQNGLLARLFYSFGIISDQSEFPLFIYDSNGIGVILAYIWKEAPFIIYFVIALMGSINSGLGEVAMNLGATRIKTFFMITLPLSSGTILSAFLIIFVYAFGTYELPIILGATLPRALPVLSFLEFQKPDLRLRPYAMAYNGILIIISIISSFIYFKLLKNATKYNTAYSI